MDYNSRLYFANYHGLVGPMQWNELIKQCCTDCDRVSIREQIINKKHFIGTENRDFYQGHVFNFIGDQLTVHYCSI